MNSSIYFGALVLSMFAVSVHSQVIFDDDEETAGSQLGPQQNFQPPQTTSSQFRRPPQQQFPEFPQTTNNNFQQPFPTQSQPSFRQSDCTTFRDTAGVCTSLNDCSPLALLLRNRPSQSANRILRRSICGFSGFVPMVCCPIPRNANQDNFNNINSNNGLGFGGFTPQQGFNPTPPGFNPGQQGFNPTQQGFNPTQQGFSPGQQGFNPTQQGFNPRPSSNPTQSPPIQLITGQNQQNPTTSITSPASQLPVQATQTQQSTTTTVTTQNPFKGGGPATLVPPKSQADHTGAMSEATPFLGFPSAGLPSNCGFSNASHSRIVGGHEAEKGAWPWLAALGYRDESGNVNYLCGGALVSSQYVITAAHCIHNRDDLFTVRFGDHDLFSDADGVKPINVEIAQKIENPKYNPSTFQNDIAILKLKQPVPLSLQVHPICLPTTPLLRSTRYERTMPFVAGWGAIQFNGPTSQVLREVQVPVVSDAVCQDKYKTFKTAHVDDSNICAGYSNGGKDACQGDSGGPFMLPLLDNKFALIGVVSFGFRCAEPGFPGVYSRVTSHLDWIQSTIQNT